MASNSIADQVKRATHEILTEPDWSLNVAIMEELTRTPRLGEEAVAVIKKRLLHKEPNVAGLALTLVDFLVKNCPKFHPFVATEDFVKALLKLLERERRGIFRRRLDDRELRDRIELKERTLVLIQTWGKAFAHSRSFPIFSRTYESLLQQGVVFPQPHKDELAPVFTPASKPVLQAPPPRHANEPYTNVECAAASESADLLFDMLTSSGSREDLSRNDLIATLYESVVNAQSRTVRRLGEDRTLADPELMDELLRLNDKLQDVLRYYEGLRKGTMERMKPAPASSESKQDGKNRDAGQRQGQSKPKQEKQRQQQQRQQQQRRPQQEGEGQPSGRELDLFNVDLFHTASQRTPVDSRRPTTSSVEGQTRNTIPILPPPPEGSPNESPTAHQQGPQQQQQPRQRKRRSGKEGAKSTEAAASRASGSLQDLFDLDLGGLTVDEGAGRQQRPPSQTLPAALGSLLGTPFAAQQVAPSPGKKTEETKEGEVESDEDEFAVIASRRNLHSAAAAGSKRNQGAHKGEQDAAAAGNPFDDFDPTARDSSKSNGGQQNPFDLLDEFDTLSRR